MDKIQQMMIETYQCPGCCIGGDVECVETGHNLECSRHVPGTIGGGIGIFFLGLPKGFCRLGVSVSENYKIHIFKNLESVWGKGYDKFNIAVWKHLDEHGNTLIRGLLPRINQPFIHIIIGDHVKKINCYEITKKDLTEMD